MGFQVLQAHGLILLISIINFLTLLTFQVMEKVLLLILVQNIQLMIGVMNYI